VRSVWRCLPLFVLMFATVAWAQDRAKPREEGKREAPPRTAHPAPRAEQPPPHAEAPPPSHAPAPAPARPPAARSDARDRHPRPDGSAVPRRPDYRPVPDARDRHPRPDPDHAYRERWYDWRRYQDDRWHGPQYHYYFPRRYDGPRWRLLYRGFYIIPHVRLPRPDIDDGWFYWPYWDAPERGCGWYRVPTRRVLTDDPVWGPRWRYWRWRLIYLCFD
jgi:hypothetical protein